MTPLRTTLLVIILLSLWAPRQAAAESSTINAVLDDASWIAAFDRAPRPDDDETARIQTHLRFVLEHMRARDVSALRPDARARRNAALDHLEGYVARGQFPRRTNDPHAGRRPRFIDDRGVHCAVAQLVADSGEPVLARAIADAHEYAYVRELEVPELRAWASAHGFSLDELAMIQPTYGPGPNLASKRAAIEQASDRITLECGRTHLAPSSLVIRLTGDAGGFFSVTTTSKEAFAKCFVDQAALAARGRGDLMDRPQIFDAEVKLALTSPQVQLERVVDAELQLQPANQEQLARTLDGEPASSRCWPREGALARQAEIAVTTDRTGLGVRVTTAPNNATINMCIERNLRSQLGEFGPGMWKLRVERKRDLAPRMTAETLRENLESFAPLLARERCYKPATPAQVRVSVAGRRDDTRFTITVDTRDKQLATCVADNLQQLLTQWSSVWHKARDGNHTGYFRVDADVQVEATVLFENLKSYEERVTRAHAKP